MSPKTIKQTMLRLAVLKNLPETSDSLRRYLEEALARDSVDVFNEIDALADALQTNGDARR
ncbi:hypothetical protein [Litoreibacter roseus]|nr:hypothetical protein [Litoreibacter roseus]